MLAKNVFLFMVIGSVVLWFQACADGGNGSDNGPADMDGDAEACEEGATKLADDGCNTCTCMDGVWSCTEMACEDGDVSTDGDMEDDDQTDGDIDGDETPDGDTITDGDESEGDIDEMFIACNVGSECASGFCVSFNGISVCSQTCTNDTECPEGWPCLDILSEAEDTQAICVGSPPCHFGAEISNVSDCGLGKEYTVEPVKVYMLPTSQEGDNSDSHLIMLPSGKNFLIDAGSPNTDLKPMLQKHNVEQVSVIITHAHVDHYGGLMGIVDLVDEVYANVPDETICDNECPPEDCWGCNYGEYTQLLQNLEDSGIFVMQMEPGMVLFQEAGSVLEVLFVNGIGTPPPTDINDTSAIIRLTVGKSRVLFAGDLNETLGGWIAQNQPDSIRAEVLKVPHHGAEGVAPYEFFEAVGASVAFIPTFISLWESDRSAKVRNLLSDLRVPALTTGYEGEVRAVLWGDRVDVNVENTTQAIGLHRIADSTDIYLQIDEDNFCIVRNELQLEVFDGADPNLVHVAPEEMVHGSFSGLCPWPNGLYTTAITTENVYLLYGDAASLFGFGGKYCHVTLPQMEAIKAGEKIITFPEGDVSYIEGREFTGFCRF